MKGTLQNRARFGGFELDLKAGELYREGHAVRLQEQPFQVLRMLVLNAGQLVTREEIRQKLWPNDTVVEFDHGINTAIQKLRQALGESADQPSYIQTVARRGYRLIVPVERVDSTCSDDPGVEAISDGSAANAMQAALRSESKKRPDDPSDVIEEPRLLVGNLVGKKVSHYRLLEILGGGGMGVVYKAEDLKLGRWVAMKFLPEELGGDSKARERFEREARAVSALSHPNICPIYEFDEYEDQPFIVMELLQGKTLREHIADGAFRLSDPAGLDIAIQVASGLEAAHEQGIIHRDIKPANIFLTKKNLAKILDFGLAKVTGRALAASGDVETATGASDAQHLTKPQAMLGTMAYMSPEQVRTQNLDVRTDLFSFGAVLYVMATGKMPFNGESSGEICSAILRDDPTPPSQLRLDVSARLEAVIYKALEKDRNLRYQHASDMRTDLQRLKLDGERKRNGGFGPNKLTAQKARLGSATAPALVTNPTGASVPDVGLEELLRWTGMDIGDAVQHRPAMVEVETATGVASTSKLRRQKLLVASLLVAGALAALALIAGGSYWHSRQPLTAFSAKEWFLGGDRPNSYEAGTDPREVFNGHSSACLRSKDRHIEGFGSLGRSVQAHNYQGKRVRFRAFVKSNGVQEWVGLWMNVMKSKDTLAFDNMQNRPIKGTTDWQEYEVVLDVPLDASMISFGVLLGGIGTVWLNGVEFDVVDADVPTTDLMSGGKWKLGEKPKLDFEK